MDALARLIHGAVDLHVHSAPSLFPRRIDHVEAARQAEESGMRAIVVKCHHHSTAPEVLALRHHVLGDLKAQLFGSVALNSYEGGLNPYIVDMTLRMGGRIVWFPTISAENHLRHHQGQPDLKFPQQESKDLPEARVAVLDERGELLPEARQILAMVAEAEAIVSPGHVSPGEALALLQGAQDAGARRVVVNHPEFVMKANDTQVQQFVRLGAFIEHSLCMYHPDSTFYAWPVQRRVEWIELVGPERTLLGTDLGQKSNPLPVEALRYMAGQLLDLGVREPDLVRMIKTNPAWLLRLDD